MAKYIDGITGAFLGKVGPVVGSSRNGIPYMKSRGNARTSAATGSELENRKKFSAAHAWKPLLPLLRVGFSGYSKTAYGYNAAKSYVLKHAMEHGRVLPELVKISYGDLMTAPDLSVILTDDGKLRFSWFPGYIPGTDGKDQLWPLPTTLNMQIWHTWYMAHSGKLASKSLTYPRSSIIRPYMLMQPLLLQTVADNRTAPILVR